MKTENIFEIVKDKNIEYYNHYSDLYLYVTDETIKIIDNYAYKTNVKNFINETDGKLMFDIPFAYSDYFKRR